MSEQPRHEPDTLLDAGKADRDDTSFHAEVRALCHDLLPSWRDVVDVRLEPIVGGITNDLNLVTPMVDGETQSTLSPVVLRTYGEGTGKFLDREQETAALLELNAQGFGARCLGVFGNGRLEEALVNTRPLTPQEMAMPAVAREIARQTRKFHEAKALSRMRGMSGMSGGGGDGGSGGGGSGGESGVGGSEGGGCEGGDAPRAQTWDVLRKWHAMAVEWDFKKKERTSTSAAAGSATGATEEEEGTEAEDAASKRQRREDLDLMPILSDIDALEAECAEIDSPVVLLHNDLLSGNFLVPDDLRLDDIQATTTSSDGKRGEDEDGVEDDRGVTGDDTRVPMTLIDFEYSCYGPRGFDLANHFNEHAGFCCDWTLLPGQVQRRAFFSAYLEGGGAGGRGGYTTGKQSGEEEKEQAMVQLAREVDAFIPVSHLWWGLWAVMQATMSTIDFDYLGYAAARLAEYRRLRASAKKDREEETKRMKAVAGVGDAGGAAAEGSLLEE